MWRVAGIFITGALLVLFFFEAKSCSIAPSRPDPFYYLKALSIVYVACGLIVFFVCLLSPRYLLSFVGLNSRTEQVFTFIFWPFWLAAQVLAVVIYLPVWILRFFAKVYPPAEKPGVRTERRGEEPYRAADVDVLVKESRMTALWRWICGKVAVKAAA